MAKVAFELSLKLKDCDKVFKEGFEPGVLLIQEIEFDLPPDYSKPLFAAELLRQESEFIERHIEVVVKEK